MYHVSPHNPSQLNFPLASDCSLRPYRCGLAGSHCGWVDFDKQYLRVKLKYDMFNVVRLFTRQQGCHLNNDWKLRKFMPSPLLPKSRWQHPLDFVTTQMLSVFLWNRSRCSSATTPQKTQFRMSWVRRNFWVSGDEFVIIMVF